jgi:AraC family transcriptional regulator, transcriptional activator of pobA
MAKAVIPVYDICTIDEHAQKDLLIARFGTYLQKHYNSLHHPHRHSFYHLVLFTKGKGSHSIDFETFPVRAFQMYFMIPGQVHSWHFNGEVDGYIIHFNDSLFSSFLQNSHYLERFHFFNGNTRDCVCQLPVDVQQSIVQLFEGMLTELEGKNAEYLEVIRLKLLELFLLAERNCNATAIKTKPVQKLTTLRSFQQLIEKHYRSIRLPKQYADLLYITPNHLNALCNDMLGKSAGDVIRDRVLLEAKRLLTNADMSITQIGDELNFADNSYFNRFFKKNAGITPDEFRKKMLLHK